jgi:hypothetical protein
MMTRKYECHPYRREHDDPDRKEAENAGERYLRDISYQPNVNQVRHEPIPASDCAERGQLGELRNEEAAKAAATHRHGNSPEKPGVDRKPDD